MLHESRLTLSCNCQQANELAPKEKILTVYYVPTRPSIGDEASA